MRSKELINPIIRYLGEVCIKASLLNDYWLDYEIWEIVSSDLDGGNQQLDDHYLLSGFIKWDGCMQWYFNDSQPGFHHDEQEQAKELWSSVIDLIYTTAKELVPTFDPD